MKSKIGFLIGNLKKFTNYKKEQTENITLKLPEEYKELDKEDNLYKKRYYALNYNQKKEYYEFEVSYKTINVDIKSELDSLDKSLYKGYGEYKNFGQAKNITLNDKNFEVYERGYTSQSEAKDSDGKKYKYYTNEKVLFYKLPTDGYLVITISANDGTISDEQVKSLINFDVNIE